MRRGVALVAVGLGALLAGCTTYSGIDRDLRQVQDQLNQVSKQVGAMRASLDSAADETEQAQQKAAAATFTANEALTLAQSDHNALTALDQKIARLDHHHPAHRRSRAAASASSAASSSSAAPLSSSPDD